MDKANDTTTMKEDPETRPTSPSEGALGEVADLAGETLTKAQNRRLLIKTNCVVLVIMIVASLLAFLDKVRGGIPRATHPSAAC